MPYRYENFATTKVTNTKSRNSGEMYYQNNVYPDIPVSEEDLYVISTMGDRLDLLAYDFYGDSTYWWIIASANSLPGDSLFPPIGAQLRIPYDIQAILSQYKMENYNR